MTWRVAVGGIERDGALEGVNLAATAELAGAVGIPVIASGGISSLDDIAALMALDDPPRAKEQLGALAALGVTRLAQGLRYESAAEFERMTERLAALR